MLPTASHDGSRDASSQPSRIDRTCADAGAKFYAILEPNAYSDNSPGYLSALRQTYEEDAPLDLDFMAWRQQRSYACDPSEYFGQDLQPIIDQLRTLWRAQKVRSDHGIYADFSDLFQAFEGFYYSRVFDAVHYNHAGAVLIADALSDLLEV